MKFYFFSKMKTQIQFNQKEKYSSPFFVCMKRNKKNDKDYPSIHFNNFLCHFIQITRHFCLDCLSLGIHIVFLSKGRLMGLVTLVLYSG